MSDALVPFVWPLVRYALGDWLERDVDIYFELAYQDPDIRLHVAMKTNSERALRDMAKAIAPMLVERMKALKAQDERRLLGHG